MHRAPLQIDGYTMGSQYHITIVDIPDNVDPAVVEQTIRQRIDALYHTVSTFLPDSELSRLNRAPSGQWIEVSPTLFELLAKSIQLSQLTQGCFDITVGELVNLWGFGPVFTDDQIPDAATVTKAKLQVGFQDVELRTAPPSVQKHKAPQLDLSAVDQGFAADLVANYLSGIGSHNFLIDIAGEFKASGNGPQGAGWRVGVELPPTVAQAQPTQSPRGEATRKIDQIVLLQNAGLATSGDYRNFFEKNGKRYSHTIDPATGNPVTHDLSSVTVISASSASADAVAKALMVMGPERGEQFARENGISARFVVRRQGGFHYAFTGNFEHYLDASRIE